MNLADLSTANVNDVTFDVDIVHPVQGATGLVVQVIGSHNENVRKLAERRVNEALKRDYGSRNKNKPQVTLADGQKAVAEKLAAATVRWFEKEGGDKPGSKPKITEGFPWNDGRLLFSTEEAEKLYSDPTYEWLTDQVLEAVDNLENFMKS